MKRPTKEQAEREIAVLDTVGTKALQERWRELYERDPPMRMRAGFLRRGIAYRLRELAFGGLKPATVRLLWKLAVELRAQRVGRSFIGDGGDEEEAQLRTAPSRPTLSPGTQLMREWNGSTEVVDITTEGLIWRGKPYKTLSAVAVAITGTKWSGPKFFGLVTPFLPSAQGHGKLTGTGRCRRAQARDSRHE